MHTSAIGKSVTVGSKSQILDPPTSAVSMRVVVVQYSLTARCSMIITHVTRLLSEFTGGSTQIGDGCRPDAVMMRSKCVHRHESVQRHAARGRKHPAAPRSVQHAARQYQRAD